MNVSRWLLQSFIFASSISAGLLLAELAQPRPEEAPNPTYLKASGTPALESSIRQPSIPSLSTVEPSVTASPAATPISPIATAAPVLNVPLASVPQTRIVSGMELTLIVTPGSAGLNDIELFFFDVDGDWASVTRVEFRILLQGSPAPALAVAVEPLHPGHAYLSSAAMRHAGIWQADVRLEGTDVSGVMGGSFQFLLP